MLTEKESMSIHHSIFWNIPSGQDFPGKEPESILSVLAPAVSKKACKSFRERIRDIRKDSTCKAPFSSFHRKYIPYRALVLYFLFGQEDKEATLAVCCLYLVAKIYWPSLPSQALLV